MKILWINQMGRPKGGCESYMQQSAQLLKKRGVSSGLIYDLKYGVDTDYLTSFDQAFPWVDINTQIRAIAPDCIYLQQWDNLEDIEALLASEIPVYTFFHDHKLFCLREHKYTALSKQTCTKKVGMQCYSCLGFVHRSPASRELSLRMVSQLTLAHRVYQKMAGYIVASEYMRSHLISHGFAPEKIHVMPLYSKANPGFPGGQKPQRDLLFVGQLVTGKGIDLLLRALAMVPDLTLDIVGDGVQANEYQALSNKLNLQNRVTFHGRQDGAKLSQFYRACTAVVVPSRAPETFGLVGLEAMKHRKAVIASKVGGMNEWLFPGETGYFFSSGHVPELVERLKHVKAHPDHYQQLGDQGYHIWKRQFQPENHINPLLGLLKAHSLSLEGVA